MIPHFEGRQAIFFDFDGVIVDSFHVKTRAFAALYADDHPEIVDDVVAYHNAHGGVSRHKKFEYFEGVLLGRTPTQQRLAELADRFAKAVVEQVIASAEIAGAERQLRLLANARTPCFVVSGTPEDELRVIVERRKLSPYFRSVHGAPAEKADILADLIAAHGFDQSRCLMVGDAMTDYRAAMLAGVPFLGVALGVSPFPADATVVAGFERESVA